MTDNPYLDDTLETCPLYSENGILGAPGQWCDYPGQVISISAGKWECPRNQGKDYRDCPKYLDNRQKRSIAVEILRMGRKE